MKLIITFILLAGPAWFIWHTVRAYRDATGTFWSRLYGATRDSATIFWASTMSAITAGFDFIMNMSDFFGAPEVRDWATAHFSPATASAILLGCLFIVMLARLRSLK